MSEWRLEEIRAHVCGEEAMGCYVHPHYGGARLGISVSDPVHWCRAVRLHLCCRRETPLHQCDTGKGPLLAPLCLARVAIAMAGSEPVQVALPVLLGSLWFLQGLKDFASHRFLILPGDASAGLHSGAPALCSHRHCFLGPQISL